MRIQKISAVLLALLTSAIASPIALQIHVISEEAGIDISTYKVAHIRGSVNTRSREVFEAEMAATESLPGDRIVVIETDGGRQSDGEQMLSAIYKEKINGTRAICVVLSKAYSMGFNILTHCDVRLAQAKSQFLVHKLAFTKFPETKNRITAKVLRALASSLDKDDEPYRQANAAAMNLSLQKYDLFADDESWWSAERLLEMKYLHGLAKIMQ